MQDPPPLYPLPPGEGKNSFSARDPSLFRDLLFSFYEQSLTKPPPKAGRVLKISNDLSYSL
jgi:hypothetical protein